MKKIIVYPGSFDPVTLGHIDIIERASKICDKLIVGVMINSSKRHVFSMQERVEMLKIVTSHIPNLEIKMFSGLLVDFVREQQANAIIRGLRAVSDYEYELQMAHLNKVLDDDIETLFMMTNIKYSYLSSSMVREISSYGGDISGLVPEEIKKRISERLQNMD